MTKPKFPINSQVIFNDDSLTLAFVQSLIDNGDIPREALAQTFTVIDVLSPERDAEIDTWEVRVAIPGWDGETWISESLLRLAQPTIN